MSDEPKPKPCPKCKGKAFEFDIGRWGCGNLSCDHPNIYKFSDWNALPRGEDKMPPPKKTALVFIGRDRLIYRKYRQDENESQVIDISNPTMYGDAICRFGEYWCYAENIEQALVHIEEVRIDKPTPDMIEDSKPKMHPCPKCGLPPGQFYNGEWRCGNSKCDFEHHFTLDEWNNLKRYKVEGDSTLPPKDCQYVQYFDEVDKPFYRIDIHRDNTVDNTIQKVTQVKESKLIKVPTVIYIDDDKHVRRHINDCNGADYSVLTIDLMDYTDFPVDTDTAYGFHIVGSEDYAFVFAKDIENAKSLVMDYSECLDKDKWILEQAKDHYKNPKHLSWHTLAECRDVVGQFPYHLGRAIECIWGAGRREDSSIEDDLYEAIHHINNHMRGGVLAIRAHKGDKE